MNSYIILFSSSFLAATIIPFSSEVVLASYLALGFDPLMVLIVASGGNCLGATVNYFIGQSGITYLLDKINFNDKKREHYQKKFQKYDKLLWFCSWMPIIGDPITVYAGVIKLRFIEFALWVYGGRIIRYVVILFLMEHWD